MMLSGLVALYLSAALGVASQAVKSCGGPSDHLTKVSFVITPDPPVSGKPFTFKVIGDLDEDLTAGTVNVSIHVKAFGIISSTVEQFIPFTMSPAYGKGPREVTVGPNPWTELPGSTIIKGQIRIVDGKKEPVACAELDIDLAKEEEDMARDGLKAKRLGAGPIESCAKASDHLKQLSVATSGGVTTIAGNLDEPLKTANLGGSIEVKKWLFHKTFPISGPISDTIGLPAGPLKISFGPVTGTLSPDPKVTVTGQVTLNDAKQEEITCLKVDTVVANKENIIV